MVRNDEIRAAERAVAPPEATDAGLIFIGRIHTPWTSCMDCPRQGRLDGPRCRIELFEPWVEALDGIAEFTRIEVLYWLQPAASHNRHTARGNRRTAAKHNSQ